jgi:hypothetical protein
MKEKAALLVVSGRSADKRNAGQIAERFHEYFFSSGQAVDEGNAHKSCRIHGGDGLAEMHLEIFARLFNGGTLVYRPDNFDFEVPYHGLVESHGHHRVGEHPPAGDLPCSGTAEYLRLGESLFHVAAYGFGSVPGGGEKKDHHGIESGKLIPQVLHAICGFRKRGKRCLNFSTRGFLRDRFFGL